MRYNAAQAHHLKASCKVHSPKSQALSSGAKLGPSSLDTKWQRPPKLPKRDCIMSQHARLVYLRLPVANLDHHLLAGLGPHHTCTEHPIALIAAKSHAREQHPSGSCQHTNISVRQAAGQYPIYLQKLQLLSRKVA